MKQLIEAVIFDFGGTLFTYEPSNTQLITEVGALFGYNISPSDPRLIQAFLKQEEQLARRWAANWPDSRKDLTKEDWIQLNQALLDELGIVHPIANGVLQYKFQDRKCHYNIRPELKGILSLLKQQGIKLGIISNTDEEGAELRRRLLVEHDLTDYFDVILFSSECREYKPSPEIFQTALRILHISDPFNVVYIGDSIVIDVKGAQHAGLRAVLFHPGNGISDPVLIIHNLQELVYLLAIEEEVKNEILSYA